MNGLRVIGGVLSIGALAGYVLGTVVAYPGRAWTIALLMIGVTLVAVGGSE